MRSTSPVAAVPPLFAVLNGQLVDIEDLGDLGGRQTALLGRPFHQLRDSARRLDYGIAVYTEIVGHGDVDGAGDRILARGVL